MKNNLHSFNPAPPPNCTIRARRGWSGRSFGRLSLAMLIAANLTVPRFGWAQTPTVPLGSAGQFGLLSGGALTTDTASAVRCAGRAGAAGSINGPVTADGGLFRAPTNTATLAAALTDLAAARSYCTGLGGAAIIPTGQPLMAGAYALPGGATLTGRALVLTGDSASRFVLNVPGNLTLAPGAQVLLAGQVSPGHVVWNISGTLTSADAGLPGLVLTGGNVTLSGLWPASSALLSGGDVTLTQMRTSAPQAGTAWVAPMQLTAADICRPTPAVPSSDICANLVYNGGFEIENRALMTPVPTDDNNVCNRTAQTTNDVEAWGSANLATPDWFRANSALPNGWRVSVPTNFHNSGDPSPTLPRPDGGPNHAYAGIFTSSDKVSPANQLLSEYREYLHQRLSAPLVAGHHYYAEFYSLRAYNYRSDYNPRQLGLSAFVTDPYQSGNGPLTTVFGTPLTPRVSDHDPVNFNSPAVWALNSGGFAATGGEKFVVIGNFDDYYVTGLDGTRLPNGPNKESYQYLDDVRVLRFPAPLIACVNNVLTLSVDCPLPASANAMYTWTGPGSQTYTSSDPVYSGPLVQAGVDYLLSVSITTANGTLYGPFIDFPAVRYEPYTVGPIYITTDITWRTDRRIHGEVIIQPGGKLTITDGAVIEFDDTRTSQAVGWQPNQPRDLTRILVKAASLTGLTPTVAGELVVKDGAILTVLNTAAVCVNRPARMWDGIVVEGTPTQRQPPISDATDLTELPTPNYHGRVVLLDCFIKHARYGVYAGKTAYVGLDHRITPGESSGPPKGGGLLLAERATFTDCYAGAYFAKYDQTNRSYFAHCRFEALAPLRDPVNPSDIFRYGPNHGTAFGVHLDYVSGVTFKGNKFLGSGLWMMPLTRPDRSGPLSSRGHGIYAWNSSLLVECDNYLPGTPGIACLGEANLFSGWKFGITVNNANAAVAVRVRGTHFERCATGLALNGVTAGEIQANDFQLNDDGSAVGLECTGSNGFTIQDNTFTGTRAYAQGGIGVYNSGPSASAPLLLIYRNRFTSMGWGIGIKHINQSLRFRCNNFDGPFGNSPNIRGAAAVRIWDQALIPAQGSCNPSDATAPANNFFLPGDCSDLVSTGVPYEYYFPQYQSTPNLLKPQRNGTGGQCLLSPYDMVTLNECPQLYNPEGCLPYAVGGRSEADLLAALAGETEEMARQLEITELLAKYLTDTAATGVAAAADLLRQENDPGYELKLLQLEEQLRQADAFGGAAANLGARSTRARRQEALAAAPPRSAKTARAEAAPPGTAGRLAGDTVDYARRVLLLLRPLPTDSARTAALALGQPLRATFGAMAEDSLRWGAQAARLALNRYAGTHYLTLFDDGLDEEPAADLGRTAPRAAYLLLAPNPSTGHVRVGYGLVHAARAIELRVYDPWGQPAGAGTYALTDEALTEGVWLNLRAGIYHCSLVADGAVVAKERLLVTSK